MPVQTHATFCADFPDDAEWDKNGLPLVPGGGNVAHAIRSAIAGRGLQSTRVEQRSFYGWEFEFVVKDHRFICVIQASETWLLICEPRVSMFQRLFAGSASDAAALAVAAIHDILQRDGRFSNVRWHFRQEYEKGQSVGTEVPTDSIDSDEQSV
jgi:hypothetical protein